MIRLTRTINALQPDIDIQEALDKLAMYENAEASGNLILIPDEMYYLDNGMHKGKVAEVAYSLVPHKTIKYKIRQKDNVQYFQGTEGINVFRTEEELDAALLRAAENM